MHSMEERLTAIKAAVLVGFAAYQKRAIKTERMPAGPCPVHENCDRVDTVYLIAPKEEGLDAR